MRQYLKISDGFMVGSVMSLDSYAGVGVAAAEGFYLIFSERQIGQAITKLQGAMADAASPFGQRITNKDARSLDCASIWRGAYADLPAEITRHPEWPRLQKVREAWFIPKEVIDRVSMSIWVGVKVRVGEAQYNFPVGMFAQRGIRGGLREMGWIDFHQRIADGT